jgi:pyridinium-3,5-bisthiocarboxylic acid mononucleotide nickel chelatase
MKVLYYDCFSGISGDMNLAAMIGLGVEQSYLVNELEKLKLNGYTITFTSDQRKGITGTRVNVILEEMHEHAQHQNVSLKIDLNNLKPTQHKHSHTHHHERNYADIKKLIQNSSLNDNIKKLSLNIFQKVAEAEAHVHGKSVDEVHFHEIGAVDSIVDIVGAAICIDYLKPDKIISSPVQLGGGFVTCAHGIFPVPAPATVEILKNIPVKMGAVKVETTTPTGAAIIATIASEFTEQPYFKIDKIAYGIGHRDNVIPNVLRVCLADRSEETDFQTSVATMIECNIDDMNPEIYEYVMSKLFEAGADDVFFQQIIMKKTRPAIKISVLCKNSLVSSVENILLTETSTLGIRKCQVQKTMLKRDWKTVDTKWGKVRIKIGLLNNNIIKSKPEYEDCLEISHENNIPISDVYKEIALLLKE